MFEIRDGVLEKWYFNEDEESLTDAFYVIVPKGVHTIGDGAFAHSNTLETVWISSSVERIGEAAFLECKNLEEVRMAAGTKELGRMAFFGCEKLHDCVIPETVERIGNDCFKSTALSHVVIPKGVEKIEEYTFSDCKKLSSVIIPDTVKEIHRWAFCSSGLRQLRIPASVSTVGSMAFSSCEQLKEITICSPNTKFAPSVWPLNENLTIRGEGFNIKRPLNKKSVIVFFLFLFTFLLLRSTAKLVALIALYFYIKKKYPFHNVLNLDDLKCIFYSEFHLKWDEVLPTVDGSLPDHLKM